MVKEELEPDTNFLKDNYFADLGRERFISEPFSLFFLFFICDMIKLRIMGISLKIR